MMTNELLQLAEQKNPGAVRLLLATRNKARMLVYMKVWNFEFIELHGRKRFTVVGRHSLEDDDNLLVSLVWHRAAEAIQAVRRGHLEYCLNRAKNKRT
jgi:hypothetical protein